MAGDWVVSTGYGTSLSIPAQTLVFRPLMRLPDSVVDRVDIIEDDDDVFMVHRIVGTIDGFIQNPTVAFHQWGWRLLPCQGDYDSAEIDGPVDATATLDDPHFANLRWWAERRRAEYPQMAFQEGLGPINHPYWTHVDCRPKQALGRKWNLWPTLAIWNGAADSMRLVQRLRLYCTYR